MSLTLAQARAKVRTRTRHVGDTVRLTDAALDVHLNDVYRELRTELQSLAPTLYLYTTIDTVLTAGQTLELTSPDVTYEQVYRVERKNLDGKWDPVPRADAYDPRLHALRVSEESPVWERRADFVYFHPEDRVSGTFRVLFYATPADLTSPATTFEIPGTVESVLIERACGLVTVSDGNDPAPFEKRAAARLDAVSSQLWREYGVHPHQVGFQSVLGY